MIDLLFEKTVDFFISHLRKLSDFLTAMGGAFIGSQLADELIKITFAAIVSLAVKEFILYIKKRANKYNKKKFDSRGHGGVDDKSIEVTEKQQSS